jgi:predicted short-subunit dehydrogenase-like oxidoreductase (DUF2520 family)
MAERELSIIGPGKVGQALGLLAAKAGYRVVAIGARDLERAKVAAGAIGDDVIACGSAEAAAAAGMVLLTVSDDAIASVCARIAEADAFRKGAVVAHCCGALGSDVLAPARDWCGCFIGSMHPLQTFPTVRAAIERLGGAYFFCEGDATAVEALERLAAALGGTPVRIDAGAKALYHAAAVVACNYLTALIDAALDLARKAGIDRATAWSAMEPLVRATVANIAEVGPEQSLTGPIARGDADTVRRHLSALADGPVELDELYRAAGKWAVLLAARKGTLSAGSAEELRRLLSRRRRRRK